MKKTVTNERLSLRAKFKSEKLVEVCIINQVTGEIILEWIPITWKAKSKLDDEKKILTQRDESAVVETSKEVEDSRDADEDVRDIPSEGGDIND